MNNYIVATIHPWNIEQFNIYSKEFEGNWYLISEPSELTGSLLAKIQPKYIFFPHWSWIVPYEIFSKYTCICFHMTDLPFGRGGSPLQNLIIRGLKKTKVSAIKMEQDIDAGPIYVKKELSLSGSAQEIFIRASEIIKDLILEIITNTPKAIPQSGKITYFKRRTPNESEIIDNLTEGELYDFIRMLDAPSYPKAFIIHNNKKIEFSNAKFINGKLTANAILSELKLKTDYD